MELLSFHRNINSKSSTEMWRTEVNLGGGHYFIFSECEESIFGHHELDKTMSHRGYFQTNKNTVINSFLLGSEKFHCSIEYDIE